MHALLCLAVLSFASAQGDPPVVRTILTLEDGRHVRANVRTVDGVHEIARGASWIAVEGVVSVRRERDVLAEMREREAKVDPHHLPLRAELARWMLAEGLDREGHAELDRILALFPDQRHALDVVRATPPRLESSDVDGLLREAAEGRASTREAVVAALARLNGGEALRTRLEHELVAGVDARRAFATLALRRLFRSESLEPLLVRAVLDPSEAVRTGAAHALRDVGDAGIATPVIRALGSKNAAVRRNAAESLGTMGYAAAVAPLLARVAAIAGNGAHTMNPRSHLASTNQVAYVQDFDVEIAQGASIAKPKVATQTEGAILDVRVGGLWTMRAEQELGEVCGALRKLTQARIGNDAQAWLEWWKAHEKDWTHAAPAATQSAPARR